MASYFYLGLARRGHIIIDGVIARYRAYNAIYDVLLFDRCPAWSFSIQFVTVRASWRESLPLFLIRLIDLKEEPHGQDAKRCR